MDRYPIRVTLLANAGVLIRYRDTALLLDGLFGRKDNPFSLLPPGCREVFGPSRPLNGWTTCCSPTTIPTTLTRRWSGRFWSAGG